jgi:NIMA-interacting peptidyl-prolyl cis-trans isomerase 4
VLIELFVQVRHILSEKHAKVMEAMEKIKSGVPFDKVAGEYTPHELSTG